MDEEQDERRRTVGAERIVEGLVYAVGVNRCIDVSEEVAEALGGGTRIAIVAEVAGTSYATTLMPRRGGRRLFLPASVRAPLGIDVGHEVTAIVQVDATGGEVAEPPDLRAALDQDAELAAAWDERSAAFRRQCIRYLERAKTPPTRTKYLAHILREASRRSG